MTDERSQALNVRPCFSGSMSETDMARPSASVSRYYYETAMEESLAENMYNLSMESDKTDDDVDLNPSPSSRAPPQPFEINNYSEDDQASEAENLRKMAGLDHLMEKRSIFPDVRVVLRYIDPAFFKFETVLSETQKWSWDSEEYVHNESYNSMDTESSYSP